MKKFRLLLVFAASLSLAQAASAQVKAQEIKSGSAADVWHGRDFTPPERLTD